MSGIVTGFAARKLGNEFEQRVAASFPAYAAAGRAFLDFMPVPTVPCHQRMNGLPLWIRKGKAPYDVYGFAPTTIEGATFVMPARRLHGSGPITIAQMIGAECKATDAPKDSLPIRQDGEGGGSGLQEHQLQALALLATNGGRAFVLWDNGGEYGRIGNDQILYAAGVYTASRQSEARGKGRGANGSRSIRWEQFERFDYANVGGTVCLDWLN
jgi:hypothetical protein